MTSPSRRETGLHVAPVDPGDPVAGRTAGRLIEEYLLRTELEKYDHGVAATPPPPRYAVPETGDPAGTYCGGTVLLARLSPPFGDEPVGVVAVTAVRTTSGTTPAAPSRGVTAVEIKRLWVRPGHRGTGAGSALLEAAIRAAGEGRPGEIRLTVWRWRENAIGLYRRAGFAVAPSWEPERPELVCMRLGLTGS